MIKARLARGDLPFDNIFKEITDTARKRKFDENGVKAGYTKEKADGTYKRPAHLTEEHLKYLTKTYLAAEIKLYFDKYPDMF